MSGLGHRLKTKVFASAVIRVLTASFVLTFALTAHAEYETHAYTFKNGNRLEFQIDWERIDSGRLVLFRNGATDPEVLKEHLNLDQVNINEESAQKKSASWLGKITGSRSSVVSPEDPSKKQGHTWFKTKERGGGTYVVDENGAVGLLPFKYSDLATATATDGNEKYLIASLNFKNDGAHSPGTYIVRSSDNKLERVSGVRRLLDQGPPTVSNGTLTIPEVPEQFNLRTFQRVTEQDIRVAQTLKSTQSEANQPDIEKVSNSPATASASQGQQEEKRFEIPFKGANEVSRIQVDNGGEKYLVISVNGALEAQGTYVVRARDHKIAKISHDALHLFQTSVHDGILSIPHLRRSIDLNAFNGEAKFQASRLKDVVLDKDGKQVDSTKRVLETYKDFVAMAKADPADFSEKPNPETVEQLVEALRSKRSAVLLGPAGAGKTSAIRALAKMIAQGEIPGIPRTLKILEVPMSQLSSGTSLVGIIEERVSMLKAAAQDGGIVYFIDETHSMSGVGTSSNKNTDITQEIKGQMEKGDFIILGASTDHEFKNAFAKDPAFIDRFDRVQVKAPEGEELIEVITARMAKEYPSAKPSRAVIEEAIKLSSDLDVVSGQPRAAVNLMKKAYAILEGKGLEDTAPDSAILKQAAIKKYGVDPARFSREETRKRLAKMDKGLEDRIVGNENGKRAIKSVWKRKLTGVGDPESVNTILFRGPPGTGKTALAKASAQEMGYDFTVIEMNKFAQSRDAIEDFRREVYSELLKNPFRVIVLDEIEKAPIAVQDAALSMLQDGQFRVMEKLGYGGGEVPRDVKAKHALFMITTNAAGDTPHLSGDELKAALHHGNISQPLLSRVEAIEYLPRPSEDNFRAAVTKYLRETLDRESKKQNAEFALANESEYIDQLMKSYTPASDYRDVKKMISKEVDEIISDAVLHDEFSEHGKVELHWHPDHQSLKFKCIMQHLEASSALGH